MASTWLEIEFKMTRSCTGTTDRRKITNMTAVAITAIICLTLVYLSKK